MFAYPPDCQVDRPVPKNRFHPHIPAGSPLRRLLTDEVAEIRWVAKLAPDTIRLTASPEAPEIQVFRIRLKGDTLDPGVLRLIDGAVRYLLFFELETGVRRRCAAATKRPHRARADEWVVDEHVFSHWRSIDAPREPLPVATSLAGLHAALVRRLLPLAPRRNESVADHLARCREHAALGRQVERLGKRLHREKQFNRRVALNQELKALAAKREELAR